MSLHMRSLARWSRHASSRSRVASVELLEGRALLAADVQVPLALSFNRIGIYTDGSVFPNYGGLDYYGYALSANQLGPTRTWNGHTFTFGPADANNVVHGGPSVIVPLPRGSHATLNILATSVNRNQPDQRFVLNYTDDTHIAVYQGISDWYSPQYYRGESIAVTTPYRVDHSGGTQSGDFHVYGYTFQLDPNRTIQSITLPNSPYTMVLAMVLSDTGTPTPAPAAPTNVTAVASSSSEIQVSWTAPAGPVTSYTIYRGATPDFFSALPYRSGVTSTTFYDTHLAPSSTWYYRVVAVGDTGTSPQSASAGATTPATQNGTVVQVLLNSAFNQIGICNDGVAFPTNGGLDRGGTALSGNLLSSGAYWLGNLFRFGQAGVNNVVHGGPNVTVDLQAGQFSSLQSLATAVNGSLPDQTFIVTYTDGTSQSFVRNVNDWYQPQGMPTDSIAVVTPYRNLANGGRDGREFYIYGLSLALNSAKTVASLTLPSNPNCIVLAANLIRRATTAPAAPAWLTATATTGRISLQWQTAPGATSYDIYRGNVSGGQGMTPYRTGITATTFADTGLVPSATWYYLVVARNAYGASGYSPEASATTPAAPVTTNVSLATAFNRTGIYTDGSTFSNAASLDGSGAALSADLLGTSVLWNGQTFLLGTANASNVIAGGATILLPAGKYSTLSILATGVNGNQSPRQFMVRYTDGSVQFFNQGTSDWYTPQSYAGESIAATMAYRNIHDGTQGAGPFHLYGYTFQLDPTRTVQSVVLPANSNQMVLAVNVSG